MLSKHVTVSISQEIVCFFSINWPLLRSDYNRAFCSLQTATSLSKTQSQRTKLTTKTHLFAARFIHDLSLTFHKGLWAFREPVWIRSAYRRWYKLFENLSLRSSSTV